MDTKWYYIKRNEQGGPFNSAEMRKLSMDGFFTSPTVVWKEGMGQWVNINDLRDGFQTSENANNLPASGDGQTTSTKSSKKEVLHKNIQKGIPFSALGMIDGMFFRFLEFICWMFTKSKR